MLRHLKRKSVRGALSEGLKEEYADFRGTFQQMPQPDDSKSNR